MEQNSAWNEHADRQTRAICESLRHTRHTQAQIQFAELMRHVKVWILARLQEKSIAKEDVDDLLGRVGLRLWKSLAQAAQQDTPPRSVLAMLTPIIRSVAVDHLRQINSAERRILDNLKRLLETEKSAFAMWKSGQTEYAGLQDWKGRAPDDGHALEAWHRERVRLLVEERLAGHDDWSTGQKVQYLLTVLWRCYPHPLPVKTVQEIAQERLAPYLPRLESLDAPNPHTGALLADTLAAPELDVATSAIRSASSKNLLDAVRGLLQTMPERTQLAMLLCLETDELEHYCKPDTAESALTPLLQAACNFSPADAHALAQRYAAEVPIPDELAARQMGITKSYLQILRLRARKRFKDGPLNGQQQEWLEP